MKQGGYDGYKIGVVVGAMSTAEEAVSTAFVAAMGMLDYDHPLTTAIRQAQDQIKAARKLESAVAGDAMTGRLEESRG